MTRTISTKDGTLDWEDAREGDVIVVNDTRQTVERANSFTVTTRSNDYHLSMLESLGAYLEREVEEHPHGVIPSAVGATIRICSDVYYRDSTAWYAAGDDMPKTIEYVQRAADEFGFEVLCPRPKVEVTDEMVEEFAPKLMAAGVSDSTLNWGNCMSVVQEAWRNAARYALEYTLGSDDK